MFPANMALLFLAISFGFLHFCAINANGRNSNSSDHVGGDIRGRESEEDKLIGHLLDGYSTLARPVQHYGDVTRVQLMFMLMRLIDMDEKNQMLQIYGWLDYTWTDNKLQWEPKEYGNISRMSVPIGKLWRPDVFLYNTVESNFETGYPTNAIVQNNGHVRWVTPSIFKCSCQLNITWFPFDEQACFLEFSTWTYPATQVDLLTDAETGFDTSQYIINGEWELSKYYVAREEVIYACCPHKPYTLLRFHMNLRRRTLYYLFNMILPSLLITIISLLSFVLPPESGDKTAIQIAVLLSICFFFSILSNMLPATSDAVPLLGLFFFCCMLIVAASLCATVYVLNLHYRTRPMGPTASALLLHWLPWLLRMKHPNGIPLKWASLPSLFSSSRAVSVHEKCAIGEEEEMPKEKHPIMECPFNEQFTILQQIQRQIKILGMRIEHKYAGHENGDGGKEEEEEREKWKFAARVLDRIFLCIFFLLITGCILHLLVRAPYLLA